MFEQLGLIGCGLMGGSFALALKQAGLVKRVVGYSKSPTTTERARQLDDVFGRAARPKRGSREGNRIPLLPYQGGGAACAPRAAVA